MASIPVTPIWKDTYVGIGSYPDEAVPFRIYIEGNLIYEGTAVQRHVDSEYATYIRINDIVADYIRGTLPTLSDAAFDELTFPLSVTVQHYLGVSGTWATAGPYRFTYDWSYDHAFDVAVQGMAFPIRNVVDLRQPIVWSGLDVEEVTATIGFTDGTTTQVIIPVAISADFSDDFSDDFARSLRSAGSGTACFYPSTWGDNVSYIIINGLRYDIVQTCNRFALYYLNAHGGWDTLLCEGNTKIVDTIKRSTMEVDYNNSVVDARGKDNYLNDITKKITLRTGLLKDNESLRMFHLLESTNVYLRDLDSGDMWPVNISDNNCEYKTFKSSGAKIPTYDIECELAKIRRRR